MILRRIVLGKDHSKFDAPRPEAINAGKPASQSAIEMEAFLKEFFQRINKNRLKGPQIVRDLFDGVTDELKESFPNIEAPAGVESKINTSPKGVWFIPEGCDTSKRMLYLHGGAYRAGSPKSHELFTRHLAKRLGVAVFSLDYRLLPENKRSHTIEDAQTAYKWVLDHGPDSKSKSSEFWVAGDSAGGNLTLMLTAWARDKNMQPVDGAIAFSPSTDDTLGGKSIYENAYTDVQLGKFGKYIKRARYPLMLLMWKYYKILPSSPKVSPLHGDLSNLPPTLMFGSNSEILVDTIVRYANKAKSQGSPVELLLWDHMTHVWPAFIPIVDEANEAMEYIVQFVEKQRS